MCSCEWNYTCPKCKGVTEHDDVYAELHADPPTPDELSRLPWLWEQSAEWSSNG